MFPSASSNGAWLSCPGTGKSLPTVAGPIYCVLSFEAVAALRAKGYRVRRLEDGYPEWKAAGLPVEMQSPASQ
jgi:hypothetical protein